MSSIPILLSKNSAAVAKPAVKQIINGEMFGAKAAQIKTALIKNETVPSADFPLEKRKLPKNLPINAAHESDIKTMHIAAAADLVEKQTETNKAEAKT